MTDEAKRIIRPWGLLGSHYEVGARGFRYYCLAWMSAIMGIACLVLRARGPGPVYLGPVLFLIGLCFTCYFTWQTTRHGRRIVG